MRSVDVALLFEKAVREIDVATALKHILASRHGLTMEIIQQNYPDHGLVREIDPKVVVLPFCYQQRSNNFFFVRWRGATFFNLTWEQLFYPGNAAAKTPRGEFAVRHVIHNAWSDGYADLLRAQGVPEQHIFVSGNPAYALYDEPYRRYFRSRADLAADAGLDASRRWVFFPENYNWAFYEPPMLEQMVRDGQSLEQVQAMRELVTRSFEVAMRWCAALARSRRRRGDRPAAAGDAGRCVPSARRGGPDHDPSADVDHPARHGSRVGACERRRDVVLQHDADRGEHRRKARPHRRADPVAGLTAPGVAFARPASRHGG